MKGIQDIMERIGAWPKIMHALSHCVCVCVLVYEIHSLAHWINQVSPLASIRSSVKWGKYV